MAWYMLVIIISISLVAKCCPRGYKSQSALVAGQSWPLTHKAHSLLPLSLPSSQSPTPTFSASDSEPLKAESPGSLNASCLPGGNKADLSQWDWGHTRSGASARSLKKWAESAAHALTPDTLSPSPHLRASGTIVRKEFPHSAGLSPLHPTKALAAQSCPQKGLTLTEGFTAAYWPRKNWQEEEEGTKIGGGGGISAMRWTLSTMIKTKGKTGELKHGCTTVPSDMSPCHLAPPGLSSLRGWNKKIIRKLLEDMVNSQ